MFRAARLDERKTKPRNASAGFTRCHKPPPIHHHFSGLGFNLFGTLGESHISCFGYWPRGPAGRCRYIFCENLRSTCTENLGFCLFPVDCTATLSMKGLMKGIRHAVTLLENAMVHLLVRINGTRKSHFPFVS